MREFNPITALALIYVVSLVAVTILGILGIIPWNE